VAIVDVHELLTQVITSAQPALASHGLTLRHDLRVTSRARLDPIRCKQILSNLLDNAIRFATSEITVLASVDHEKLRVFVEDDGHGISPIDLPRVFTAHFTSDVSGASTKGTGLGLAIVKELCQLMGGSVDAISPRRDADQGTRMEVRLPLYFDVATEPKSGTS
jgi:signal transduction histidine kinase